MVQSCGGETGGLDVTTLQAKIFQSIFTRKLFQISWGSLSIRGKMSQADHLNNPSWISEMVLAKELYLATSQNILETAAYLVFSFLQQCLSLQPGK